VVSGAGGVAGGPGGWEGVVVAGGGGALDHAPHGSHVEEHLTF